MKRILMGVWANLPNNHERSFVLMTRNNSISKNFSILLGCRTDKSSVAYYVVIPFNISFGLDISRGINVNMYIP